MFLSLFVSLRVLTRRCAGDDTYLLPSCRHRHGPTAAIARRAKRFHRSTPNLRVSTHCCGREAPRGGPRRHSGSEASLVDTCERAASGRHRPHKSNRGVQQAACQAQHGAQRTGRRASSDHDRGVVCGYLPDGGYVVQAEEAM